MSFKQLEGFAYSDAFYSFNMQVLLKLANSNSSVRIRPSRTSTMLCKVILITALLKGLVRRRGKRCGAAKLVLIQSMKSMSRTTEDLITLTILSHLGSRAWKLICRMATWTFMFLERKPEQVRLISVCMLSPLDGSRSVNWRTCELTFLLQLCRGDPKGHGLYEYVDVCHSRDGRSRRRLL
jgi:hypothetical protein